VDALMKAGYPVQNAYSFKDMHHDDVRAVKTLYPGTSIRIASYHEVKSNKN